MLVPPALIDRVINLIGTSRGGAERKQLENILELLTREQSLAQLTEHALNRLEFAADEKKFKTCLFDIFKEPVPQITVPDEDLEAVFRADRRATRLELLAASSGRGVTEPADDELFSGQPYLPIGANNTAADSLMCSIPEESDADLFEYVPYNEEQVLALLLKAKPLEQKIDRELLEGTIAAIKQWKTADGYPVQVAQLIWMLEFVGEEKHEKSLAAFKLAQARYTDVYNSLTKMEYKQESNHTGFWQFYDKVLLHKRSYAERSKQREAFHDLALCCIDLFAHLNARTGLYTFAGLKDMYQLVEYCDAQQFFDYCEKHFLQKTNKKQTPALPLFFKPFSDPLCVQWPAGGYLRRSKSPEEGPV